jgi:hypothetical protein
MEKNNPSFKNSKSTQPTHYQFNTSSEFTSTQILTFGQFCHSINTGRSSKFGSSSVAARFSKTNRIGGFYF